jgi:hypothetical protein
MASALIILGAFPMVTFVNEAMGEGKVFVASHGGIFLFIFAYPSF